MHVFYSPHPDDEAIAMAGAVTRAGRGGEQPLIVHVFDSHASERAEEVFRGLRQCPWHQTRHAVTGPLDPTRRLEAEHAAGALGAATTYLGIPEDEPTFALTVERVLDAYRMAALVHQGAVHHVVAGGDDVHALHPGGRSHRSHRACFEAGLALRAAGHRVVVHRVYVYSLPLEQRAAFPSVELSAGEAFRKRAALAEYARWDPGRGRLAYGYHSVPELFDAAANDRREYEEALP